MSVLYDRHGTKVKEEEDDDDDDDREEEDTTTIGLVGAFFFGVGIHGGLLVVLAFYPFLLV